MCRVTELSRNLIIISKIQKSNKTCKDSPQTNSAYEIIQNHHKTASAKAPKSHFYIYFTTKSC